MIEVFVELTLLFLAILLLPFIAAGVSEKVAAARQHRAGGSFARPLKTFARLFKSQSDSHRRASSFAVSQLGTALNLSTTLLVSCLLPWLSCRPTLAGDDIVILLYLLLALRAMDLLIRSRADYQLTAPIKQREYLFLLIDPFLFVVLSSLGLASHSSNMSAIFDFNHPSTDRELFLWIFAGLSFFFFNLIYRVRVAHYSHLPELAAIDEQAQLGSAGKDFALKEYTLLLQQAVLYGASIQCFLHALTRFASYQYWLFALASIIGILFLAALSGIIGSAPSPRRQGRMRSILVCAMAASLGTAASALFVIDANFAKLPKTITGVERGSKEIRPRTI
jgi:formate hydrogenlyase subunit 4